MQLLSSNLQGASYGPKSGLRSNLMAPNIKSKNLRGSMPPDPPSCSVLAHAVTNLTTPNLMATTSLQLIVHCIPYSILPSEHTCMQKITATYLYGKASHSSLHALGQQYKKNCVAVSSCLGHIGHTLLFKIKVYFYTLCVI